MSISACIFLLSLVQADPMDFLIEKLKEIAEKSPYDLIPEDVEMMDIGIEYDF